MREIVWSYRPDDRSKQGKTESLPDDLAAMKVREGLAVWPKPKPEADPEPESAKTTKAADTSAKVLKQSTSPAS